MGLTESFISVIMGLIYAAIIGAFIVGLYPTLSIYYGNSEVFVLGSIILLIVGIIGLIFLLNVLKKAGGEIQEKKDKIVSQFRGTE